MKIQLLFKNSHLQANLKRSSFYTIGRIAASFENKKWIIAALTAYVAIISFIDNVKQIAFFIKCENPVAAFLFDLKDSYEWGLAIFDVQRNS